MGIRILIAGGGTSGHINPAIAIADKIREEDPDSAIEFCGTSRGLESDIVPRAGYVLHPIRARGMPSKPSVRMIRAMADFAAGRKTCIRLIRDFRPDVIVGTGGYVCSPLVAAAYHMKVPVLLHEQNAFPGRSNRLMSRNAEVVCTSFPGIEKSFPRAKKVVFTGNPVKKVFFETDRAAARRELGILEGTFFLLAMGGSLGARTINNAVLGLAEKMAGQDMKIVLSAGKQQHAALKEDADRIAGSVEIKEYIYNPQTYMAAADLLVCRAGAITCAEVAALGVPTVMIPYPYAAGDHQTYNARAFEERGACILMKDADITSDSMYAVIADLRMNPERLLEMGRRAKGLARPEADHDIAAEVFRLAGGGR